MLQDNARSSRMLVQEVGDIIYIARNDYPAVVACIVLCDLLSRDELLARGLLDANVLLRIERDWRPNIP